MDLRASCHADDNQEDDERGGSDAKHDDLYGELGNNWFELEYCEVISPNLYQSKFRGTYRKWRTRTGKLLEMMRLMSCLIYTPHTKT